MTAPTTFILAGGNDRTTNGYGEHLKNEITKHVPHPKILSCFFSSPEQEWPIKYQQWKGWFSSIFGHGLSMVDANIMVHYGSPNHEGKIRTHEDWEREEAEFQEFIGAGEKITRVLEGWFVVRTVDI